MRVFLIFILAIPLLVFGYESVIAQPETATAVLPLAITATEKFGALDDFPHTYEFSVSDTLPFYASVFVHEDSSQKNDVSIIVVKQERRGVSEIGRTRIQDTPWETNYDPVFAESFRNGGTFEATLEPGTYILEVSSPNNDGLYRLKIGDPKRGYFENLQALFEVKKLLGTSVLTTFLSPLIYVPLLFLLISIAGYMVYTKIIRGVR